MRGGLGGLFSGGAPEYSNTELAGVPCKCDATLALCCHLAGVSLNTPQLVVVCDVCGDVAVTGMSPLSPYLNVDPRYLVQVKYSFLSGGAACVLSLVE